MRSAPFTIVQRSRVSRICRRGLHGVAVPPGFRRPSLSAPAAAPRHPRGGLIRKTRIVWLSALLVVLFSAGPVKADFAAGIAALERKDFAAAAKEFAPLARGGRADAQFRLALLYFDGRGVAQNHGTALRWFRAAATQGLAPAQYSLGFMLQRGQGTPQNHGAATDWYRKAAEQGHLGAQIAIAAAYADGRGVGADPRQAAKWYAAAAQAGSPQAQFNLGVLHAEGRGVEQSFALAAKWFASAAGSGLVVAQHNLAILYAEGAGMPRDLIRAYMWFSVAVAGGHGDAALARDAVAGRMTPEQIDVAEHLARTWKAEPD